MAFRMQWEAWLAWHGLAWSGTANKLIKNENEKNKRYNCNIAKQRQQKSSKRLGGWYTFEKDGMVLGGGQLLRGRSQRRSDFRNGISH
eukprot:4219437-Amphidinium_carterae.1